MVDIKLGFGLDTQKSEAPKEEPKLQEGLKEPNLPKQEGETVIDMSPNVIFIGTRRRNGEDERLAEGPTNLISGQEEFSDLPSGEEQLHGFYYERAAELCRAFPGLYKRLIKKGE